MANNANDEVMEKDMTEDVEEVVDTEKKEIEEPNNKQTVNESESEKTETETEEEPEQPNKSSNPTKKNQEVDTDAELDEFFEKLRKNKERQDRAKKEDGEKKFTQADFEKALKNALAKRLPSKEEREQFEKWRDSQQTIEEKMSVLRVANSKLQEEVESLRHENMIVKAGVDKDAVEFVQYKVEKMKGDFEENLQDFLAEHKRYVTPKTTIVEAAEHNKKVKTGITQKDLDKMSYAERAKFREEHPDEYAKAMGR